MERKENGVILQEAIVRKPSRDESVSILRAQAEHADRLIIAEWFDETGVTRTTATISSSPGKTPNEIRELSEAITGANRLFVQKVLRF